MYLQLKATSPSESCENFDRVSTIWSCGFEIEVRAIASGTARRTGGSP